MLLMEFNFKLISNQTDINFMAVFANFSPTFLENVASGLKCFEVVEFLSSGQKMIALHNPHSSGFLVKVPT